MLLTPETGMSKRRVKRSPIGVPPNPAILQTIRQRGPLKFAYASQNWDSGSTQCSRGDWDNGNFDDFVTWFVTGEEKLPVSVSCSLCCYTLYSIHNPMFDPTD